MSIYATLSTLRFPARGDCHTGCSWVTVLAQGVPDHVGREELDQFADFLPALEKAAAGLRAVVFVTEASPKGTARSPQEYRSPLLVMSGADYRATSFQTLHDKLCESLRGRHPRVVAEKHLAGGRVQLVFEDGSISYVEDS